MNAEEIRKKAFECSSECDRTVCQFECDSCELYNPYGSCSAVYGYEHGFADGVEEGKKQSVLSKLDIDEQYEVSKKIEADIRADERKKVLDDIIKAFTDHCQSCTGCCEECNSSTFENIVDRMKGDQT